ncbi:MAG: hypothetical protein ACP5IE_04775, partial [Infirmifilum sp.]
IKHASYGYSGLFDRVKIREKELQTLLELDYKLLTQASKVMEKVLELSTVTDQELMEKINNAIDIVRQMEDDINQRENLFKTVVSE